LPLRSIHPDFQEYFLGYVFGIGSRSEHAIAHPNDPIQVSVDKFLRGGAIAARYSLNQITIRVVDRI
jgi:hypothetical protein